MRSVRPVGNLGENFGFFVGRVFGRARRCRGEWAGEIAGAGNCVHGASRWLYLQWGTSPSARGCHKPVVRVAPTPFQRHVGACELTARNITWCAATARTYVGRGRVAHPRPHGQRPEPGTARLQRTTNHSVPDARRRHQRAISETTQVIVQLFVPDGG